MAAMIFSLPPQFGQCSRSISKTRLSRLAQPSRTGPWRARSASHSAGDAALAPSTGTCDATTQLGVGRQHAVCAYLWVPDSVAFDPSVKEMMAHWHGRLALSRYYSFCQMLMLGYSDVTPVRASATTLRLFVALFGMFHTAIVIAQFVGLA